MKSFFRIYAKTSKGNDNFLIQQLKSFGLSPKYDHHLNAFYFNSNFKNLFDISYRCMSVEQMYVQVGQKFSLIDQEQISLQLQKIPFKNYMPIQRNLIQNTTLKILIRQSAHIPSQNVLINLFQTTINKQIVKRQYFQKIVNNQLQQNNKIIKNNLQQQIIGKKQRKNGDSYFDIKTIVDKKWYQQDLLLEEKNKSKMFQLSEQIKQITNKHNNLNDLNDLNKNKKKQNINANNNNKKVVSLGDIYQIQQQTKQLQNQLNNIENFNKQIYLSELISYHPHLIFYIRKNRGRILLKINTEDLYKHGFKRLVNYGPIRQSIASSILSKSKLLNNQNTKNKVIKIWDPMCGSGTLSLVASTMLDNIPIRNVNQNLFLWKKWPIYKKQYLQLYLNQRQTQKIKSSSNYQLILSDKDRQTINYSIQNLRQFITKNKQYMNNQKLSNQLFPSKNIFSQVLQLWKNKIGYVCGDFQQVIKILIPKIKDNNNKQKKTQYLRQQEPLQNDNHQKEYDKINIITNLPYLHGRSQQKYPLNQLKSIYKRFSQMIKQNKKYIDNVFIIIDKNTNDSNHFINVSTQKWNLITQYTSGGLQICLYSWENNLIKPQYQNQTNLTTFSQIALTSQQRELVLKKQKSVQRALIQYRKKLSQIDRKYYQIPKYLMKDKKGWQRILQKRRRRHLQSAYELFAKRRDKMIAFKQYANLKLELKMIKRGTVWKNKNLKFFGNNNQKLVNYSTQIGQLFEKRIQQAVKRQSQFSQKRKVKQGNKLQIVKTRNKWNSDEKRLVKQMKNSSPKSYIKNGLKDFKISIKRK